MEHFPQKEAGKGDKLNRFLYTGTQGIMIIQAVSRRDTAVVILQECQVKLTMLGTGRAVVTECYNTCFVLTRREDISSWTEAAGSDF